MLRGSHVSVGHCCHNTHARPIAEADPQKAKALLRLLIEELRANGRAEILPTYRLITPTVCAMSEKVELAGLEPTALVSGLALSRRALAVRHSRIPARRYFGRPPPCTSTGP